MPHASCLMPHASCLMLRASRRGTLSKLIVCFLWIAASDLYADAPLIASSCKLAEKVNQVDVGVLTLSSYDFEFVRQTESQFDWYLKSRSQTEMVYSARVPDGVRGSGRTAEFVQTLQFRASP
jgi:hypothetical protein